MKFYENTISSRLIYSGKILTLRLDEVKLPNGKTSTREIVEHPGAVAIVALNEKNEVLMVRQFRKPVEEELLELPAGKLEKGEQPEICAQRELMEETGFFARSLRYITAFYTSPGFSSERMYLYLARDLENNTKLADEDEFIDLKIIPLEQAVRKIYDGEIRDAKTISGLLLAYNMLKLEKE